LGYFLIDHPLARRLYRYLDKVTHYKPNMPYAIDVFDLANKLGLAQYQYASQVKRLLAAAADKLVESEYLTRYEFFKVGKYTRIRFHRYRPPLQMELFCNTDETNKAVNDADPLVELWATVVDHFLDERFPKKLARTQLLSIENGTATIVAGDFRDWIENRLGDKLLKALQREMDEIIAVRFVE
jgi:hypothetical protein